MSLLKITGAVDVPREFALADLAALPDQLDDIAQMFPGKAGAGVRLRSLLDAAGAHGDHLTLIAADGFSICVPRASVETGVVTYRVGDAPLPAKMGGPVRFYVAPGPCEGGGAVDACANVKGLVEVRVTDGPAPDTHRH